MGGRGSSSGRAGGGKGVNPKDIVSVKDMISERNLAPEAANDFLTVSRDIVDQYGENINGRFVFAELKGRSASSAIAYYDSEGNIALNTRFADAEALTKAYDSCVESGYHPGRGAKSGSEAVAAHEFGHALTEAVGVKMGMGGFANIDTVSTRIVNEARQATSHRGVVQLAAKISKYATTSNAEAIAEAFSDVYCNGSRARAESRAIVSVMDKYLR